MSINIPSIINLFSVDSGHFVQDAYAVILGREPDPSGIATYEKKLGRGTSRRRRKIILALARSPEARVRSRLLYMIAKEAVRIQRWRLLPWNRSAMAIAVAQAESQSSQAESRSSIEALIRAVEHRLFTMENKLHTVENKLHTVEDKLHSIEWTRSAGHAAQPNDATLPLIEHTMRSLKGISFSLNKIESGLKG